MNMHPTYKEIASDIALWREYFDVGRLMNDEEFAEQSVDRGVELLVEAFGPEKDLDK